MPFGLSLGAASLIGGAISGAGSLIGSLFGSSAATKASQAQVAQEQKALDFQKSVYSDQKANQAPFVSAGQSSIGQLMTGLSNGTFGIGSLPAFKAPTAAEAQATPGYQFTLDQGNLGIERGAAAAGGAFTGGTLKSLAGFNSGLADSTYNSTFSRALSAYNTLLSSQQQEYNQLAGVAQIGEGAAAGVNANGTAAAQTIGNTLSNIGNAQASGIVGSANALAGGITNATSSISNGLTMPAYLQYLKQPQGNSQQPVPTWTPGLASDFGLTSPQGSFSGTGAG
jgi:hypothetical protein